MAMSYRTIPISDLADISNIPIANEPADSIDFTKRMYTFPEPPVLQTPALLYLKNSFHDANGVCLSNVCIGGW